MSVQLNMVTESFLKLVVKVAEANRHKALGRALKKMVAAIIILLLLLLLFLAHKKVVEVNKLSITCFEAILTHSAILHYLLNTHSAGCHVRSWGSSVSKTDRSQGVLLPQGAQGRVWFHFHLGASSSLVLAGPGKEEWAGEKVGVWRSRERGDPEARLALPQGPHSTHPLLQGCDPWKWL